MVTVTVRGTGLEGSLLGTSADRGIVSGAIRPLIVVMPGASTPYGACF
ncbi:MAG: hypothetical protein P8Y02_03155 [Deinococcales bacterium]